MSNYLQPAWHLANERGYLRDPSVMALPVPEWFEILGTDEGLRAYEVKYQVSIPAVLREFYRLPLLARFVEKAMDGEVLLEEFRKIVDLEMPAILDSPDGPFLVVAFHNHSGQICAVPLGEDDPQIGFGLEEDEDDIFPIELTPTTFSQFIFAIVSNHE